MKPEAFVTIAALGLLILRTPVAWAQEDGAGHPSFTGAYGGQSRAQAESLLRSMFDTRMARQALQAPLAHPRAPTSHSSQFGGAGLASRQEKLGFHPLKVTGASTFLSSHRGAGGASVPTKQSGLAEELVRSSERGSSATDFSDALRQRFREDTFQRFA
jgi:hypothetical protein